MSAQSLIPYLAVGIIGLALVVCVVSGLVLVAALSKGGRSLAAIRHYGREQQDPDPAAARPGYPMRSNSDARSYQAPRPRPMVRSVYPQARAAYPSAANMHPVAVAPTTPPACTRLGALALANPARPSGSEEQDFLASLRALADEPPDRPRPDTLTPDELALDLLHTL